MWPTSDPNKAPQQATGQLKFPADRLLTYRPYPIVLGHNNYLTRFRPGDIFEILLTTRSANKTAISADVAEDYLQATAVVPANSLVLQFNSGDLSLESLHLIEKFQSIKYLNTGEAVPPNMLAHLATIGQLRDIGTQGADVSELVMRLKNSPTVRKLRLGDAKLSLADIANLTTMPNLELLHIKQVKPSNTSSTVQALNLLSKLPHLHKLIISSLPVTSESLKVLQSFKGLLECQVDADESGIHDEDRLPLLREAARLHLPLRFTY